MGDALDAVGLFTLYALFTMVLLAFWGTIGYVAWNFVEKFW